jgi:hypothetical protein
MSGSENNPGDEMAQPKAEWHVLTVGYDSIMWTFTGWLVCMAAKRDSMVAVFVPDPKHEWGAAREACGLCSLKI